LAEVEKARATKIKKYQLLKPNPTSVKPAQKNTVYVIAGPTAVGKTAAAIALAQKLNTEIISADSRQCYKEMSIGTAKPSAEELAAVKHHFVNEYPVTRHITAADYEELALEYLEEIFKKADTAVVCGGTGLYIKALCEGLDEMPDTDPEVAIAVNNEYVEKGLGWLQEAVRDEDPVYYSMGEIQNPARLLRALIFMRSTGESIYTYRKGNKKQRPFKIVKVGLKLPKEELYERINQRVLQMMDAGLEAEARGLYEQRHLKNLQTVGYTELFDHIDGKTSLQKAVELIQQHTRNYAKRQMTWFRKDKEYKWYDAGEEHLTDKILSLKH
jgi:tRNA dimethylallyltransferase